MKLKLFVEVKIFLQKLTSWLYQITCVNYKLDFNWSGFVYVTSRVQSVAWIYGSYCTAAYVQVNLCSFHVQLHT